jgi:hypothetical protein
LFGSTPIFIHALESIKAPKVTEINEFPSLQKSISSLFNVDQNCPPEFLDLVITFSLTNQTEIVKNTPAVRVYLQSEAEQNAQKATPNQSNYNYYGGGYGEEY